MISQEADTLTRGPATPAPTTPAGESGQCLSAPPPPWLTEEAKAERRQDLHRLVRDYLSKSTCAIWCIWDRGDLDGRCSLEIVRRLASIARVRSNPWDKAEPATVEPPPFHPVGYRHGDDVAAVVDSIPAGDVVFVVDTCLPMALMDRLKVGRMLVWVDHHASSIEAAVNESAHGVSATTGLRVATQSPDDYAACELTWRWCFPDEPMPFGVRMLGRWDVWNHDYHPSVADFQAAMLHTAPDYPWQEMLNASEDDLASFVATGAVIRKVYQRLNENSAKNCGTLHWRGIAWAVLNSTGKGSKQAELYALARPEITAILIWGWDTRRLCYALSFYTAPGIQHAGIDLPALARELDPPREGHSGGGGHPGACGCAVGGLPFCLHEVKWEDSSASALN